MYQYAMDSARQPQRNDEPWDDFMNHFHASLENLEQEIDQVSEMRKICKDEWCEATECFLDQLTVAVFAISEPRWTSPADSKSLKQLKKRIHDLHAESSPRR